jgi:carboxyl-terminal processing protease
LQDHGRAVVIGERTFGQGIVRSIFPLKDGIGSLKLPVAAYYRPSGKNMNRYPGATESDEWGVSPNPGYELVLTDLELEGFVKDRAARDSQGNPELPAGQFVDRQLAMAKDYLEGRPVPK